MVLQQGGNTMAIYIVTYRLLIGKPAAQAAIEEHNLPLGLFVGEEILPHVCM
jgi:hypothetical protein